MTIAEKIIRAKEDYDAVHEASEQVGYEKGRDAGYQDGFGAGRQEGYNHGYDDGSQDGYNAGYPKGKQDERTAFWDVYLKDVNHQYLFYSGRWSDENFYPNRDLNLKGSLTFTFSSHYITNLKQRLIDCGVTLDTSRATGGNFWFAFCSRLTNIPTLSFVGLTDAISTTFDNCPKLKEIEKIILKEDGSTTFQNWFNRLPALEDITFEGVIGNDINFSSSTKLSKASITNIINHLSDTASGRILTLSRAAVESAFVYGVDPDGDGVYDWFFDEGAWVNLIAPKIGTTENPKWIISLV